MAIFNSFLFGDLRQGLHNLVMYRSRNQGIVRGKPLKPHNPRTIEQQQTRIRFKEASILSLRLYDIAKIGFPDVFPTNSRTACLKANMEVFEVNDKLEVCPDYSRMTFSVGKLEKPLMQAALSDGSIQVELLPQNISAFASRQDKIYVVLWEQEQKEVKMIFFGDRGVSQSQSYALPGYWMIENVNVYAFATSANGLKTSDTLFMFCG